MKVLRVTLLAVAFLVVGCGTQAAVTSPKPSASPIPSPTNNSRDVLYVRSWSNAHTIAVIEARTGAVLRTMRDGVLSADRSQAFSAETTNGGTQTLVRVSELATGRELRSFTLAGAFGTVFSNDGSGGLSPDGHWLTLWGAPFKLNDQWVTRFALVDTAAGTTATSIELKGANTCGYIAVSPDGKRLYLNEAGGGATRLRVWDVRRKAFLPESTFGTVWSGLQEGFVTSAISTDGRWLFRLDVGDQSGRSGPSVVAVDLVGTRALRLALPADHGSTDFERYLLWSLALTPDGVTLYAVNPALGVADAIDARQMTLRRAGHITVSRAEDGVLAAIGRFFFPVAEAKRIVRGGAVLSPDGRTLYAVGSKGIAALDTATLESRAVFQKEVAISDLALSPDGARIYAISDNSSKIFITDTRSGASLGEIKPSSQPQTILRIDLP